MLSATQMSVLRYHYDAGDRIAYYTALADFGDEYGRLALEVVLNNTVSGASANSFFRDQAGGVTNDTLAAVSLELMRADFSRRDALNGGDLTVDDIQRYHREVFNGVAGATADAWTPNMYLDTFETLPERQAAWDEMVSNGENFFGPGLTFASITARQSEVIQSYIDDNPSVTAPVGTLLTSTLQELLSFGVDVIFAQWILDYSSYLADLRDAGSGSFFFVSPNGPFQVGIPEAGNMIGGSSGDNTLVGTVAEDVMMGMGSDDTLIGGDGADRFYGGAGDDTVDYSYALSGIVVQLGALQGGTADEWAPINADSVVSRMSDGQGNWDFAIDVEEIVGTSHDDRVQFFGDADDYFNADDVDTLLEGGGNTDLGDLLDFSAMIGVQAGLTAIWDASGTINFNTGSWAAAGVARGFEAIIGTSGNDSISGGDGADRINGHLGADSLFGGGADDFIFFDAADGANVIGGAGRDVAVALGQAGVTANLLAQGLEVVVGSAGADTITMGGGAEILFAAGGDGADRFVITPGEVDGPRVIWGGGGADEFVFADGVGGGIAVVTVEGLTAEKFASLTVADLNLGNLNLGVFRAIILNPDATDQFILNGNIFSDADMPGDVEWKGFTSETLSANIAQGQTVYGGYQKDYEFEAQLEVQRDAFENVVSITDYLGSWLADGSEAFDFYEYDPDDQAEQDAAEAFIQSREDEPVFRMTNLETNPNYAPSYGGFFVVGGNFSGASLVATGSLAATAPDDPGSSPFDWLLVA